MDIRVEYHGAFCIFAALLCLTLPLPWVVAAVTAAMIHEAFHILAVLFLGGTIHTLTVGIHGAVMNCMPMSTSKQFICILAGPVGSLLLVLAGRLAPKLAWCGVIQGLFNLLPLYPLDGGRALRCIAEKTFLPKTSETICKWTERSVVAVILYLGIWTTFVKKLGIAPFIISILLVSRVWSGKKSCKERNLGVQ